MNKTAYNLGVKLALIDANVAGYSDVGVPDLSEAENPAEALATFLQGEPEGIEEGTVEPDEPIGAPKDDGRTYSGQRSGNISSDIENSLGLDIRGPEESAITS